MSTQLRNNTYYLRLRVPQGLKGLLGKSEIVRSLRTQNYRQALSRSCILKGKITGLWLSLTAEETLSTRTSLKQRSCASLEQRLRADEAPSTCNSSFKQRSCASLENLNSLRPPMDSKLISKLIAQYTSETLQEYEDHRLRTIMTNT